ncbi:MAG: EAL domain-containing protein [Gammaproteobacteria bacterium]|nr:EAL domain-containing protein [Gammaproteobacteria bacterium]
MKLRLASRIVVFFVLLTAGLLGTVAVLSYRSGSKSLEAGAIAELLAKAVEKEAALDTWIDERFGDIELIANHPNVSENAARLIAAVPMSAEARSAHAMLLRELESYLSNPDSAYLELFVMDPKNGRVIVSTSPAEEGKSKVGHLYFDNGKTDLYLQTPYYSADIKLPLMTAALPLRNANGRVMAVLAARFSLAALNTIALRRSGLHQTEDAFLINAEQYPVTQPRFMLEPVMLRHKLDTEAVRRCAARDSGVVSAADYRGVPSIAVYRWNTKRQLGLIVKIDQAEAFAPVRVFGESVLLISLLVLLVAALLAFQLAHTITQPLRALNDSVRRFAAGDLQQPFVATSDDEVGLLAREFKQMSARVIERNTQLAKINEDLHAEIAERKAIEMAHARLVAILESTTDLVSVADPSGHLLYLNRAGRRLLGVDINEDITKTVIADFLPNPANHPILTEGIPSAIRHGNWSGETVLLSRHGQEFPVSQVILAHKTADGQLQVLSTIMRDISERKKSEEQLRLSAEALANIAEGVLIVDAHSKIIFANKAFVSTSGYEVEEALGRTPAFLQSGRQDKAFYTDMWQQLTATDHWQGEVWDKHKNGGIYPVLLSLSALRNKDGVVTHYVGIQSDISMFKSYETQLEHQAHHDALTQLPNRTLFRIHLEAALARARRSNKNLALLFLDLDRFKVINDTLGHTVGDELLRGASDRLKQSIRETDMVARLGGDEFVILLDMLDSSSFAEQIARKIIDTFAAAFNIDGQELYVTASIGISCFPDDGDDIVTLFKKADSAMYEAKANGRNTFRFFSLGDMNARSMETLKLSNDLRHAIARNELYLEYQPRFSLKNRSLEGMEALARWHHPTRGTIPPGIFIPIAEQTGLMVQVGDWVLREACRQICAWRDAGLDVPRVAVNLSALQFTKADLANQIAAIIEEYKIEPGMLELELTESVIMADVERSTRALTELNAMGLLIAIDDFGTGYSSLSYLKRFPVSYLKIDQSFVAGVCNNPDDAAIIRAIIALAKSLGLKLIAEGVETADQREFLTREACDEAQGFLFSHPLPAVAAAGLLESCSRDAKKNN